MNIKMRDVIPPYDELRDKRLSWFKLILCILICLSMLMQGYGQCEKCVEICDVDPGTSRITITTAGYWKVIESNGIPDHLIGQFPCHPLDECKRPTKLKPQDYIFVIPAYSSEEVYWTPEAVFYLPSPPFIGQPQTTFGVAVNGVPFDPAANEWWDYSTDSRVPTKTAWTINPLRNRLMEYDLDCNNGHVQPNGAYHYHGFPTNLFEKIKSEQETKKIEGTNENDITTQRRSGIVLLGWAFDGNPIYAENCGINNDLDVNAKSSYRLHSSRSGINAPLISEYPSADFLEDFYYDEALFDSDRTQRLDECHGHVGPTPEFPDGVYHYHILEKTNDILDMGFPYIGRCYRTMTYRSAPDIFPK